MSYSRKSLYAIEITLISQIKAKQEVFDKAEIFQYVTGFITCLRFMNLYNDTDITNMVMKVYEKTGLI